MRLSGSEAYATGRMSLVWGSHRRINHGLSMTDNHCLSPMVMSVVDEFLNAIEELNVE